MLVYHYINTATMGIEKHPKLVGRPHRFCKHWLILAASAQSIVKSLAASTVPKQTPARQ